MIFGVILAGGVGTRMQMDNMPKQFLPLGDKPIIVHTTQKLMLCERIDVVYVGIHPSWHSYMSDLVVTHNIDAGRLRITDGGETRSATLFNVIDAIEKEYGESEDHIIVTHDAVRPFVTLRILEDSIDAALAYGACDTVTPAIDTIVESLDGSTISSIPLRNTMYQGQTPQSFRLKKLKSLYGSLTEEAKATLTDACKIYVLAGEQVKLVEGDVSNFKITTIQDYRIAQAMLGDSDD